MFFQKPFGGHDARVGINKLLYFLWMKSFPRSSQTFIGEKKLTLENVVVYENSSRGKDSQRKNNGGNSRENIDAVRDGNSRPRLRYNRFFGNERCLKFRLHTVTLILHHIKIKNYLNCV